MNTKSALTVTSLVVASLFAFGSPSMAAQGPACNPREKVLSYLAKKYNEAPVVTGVTSGGALFEVLSSGEGSTWTVILTRPDGISCLLASGEALKIFKFQEPHKADAPA